MIVYRLEHVHSKLGPFQHGMSERSRKLLQEYWENIPNVSFKFPPPTEDPLILENKNIPQNLIYRFVCLREEDIYEWLGKETLSSLKKEGFVVREYIKDVDFDYIVFGTNQAVIFINP